MNTQKNLFIAGGILLGVIALSLVFMAGRMSGRGFEGRGREYHCSQNIMRGNNQGKFGAMGNGEIPRKMKFFSGISGDQQKEITAIQEKYKTQMQTLIQSAETTTGTNTSDLTQKITDLWNQQMSELRPFVSPSQLSGFDAFAAQGKPQMGMMFGGKGRNNR